MFIGPNASGTWGSNNGRNMKKNSSGLSDSEVESVSWAAQQIACVKTNGVFLWLLCWFITLPPSCVLVISFQRCCSLQNAGTAAERPIHHSKKLPLFSRPGCRWVSRRRYLDNKSGRDINSTSNQSPALIVSWKSERKERKAAVRGTEKELWIDHKQQERERKEEKKKEKKKGRLWWAMRAESKGRVNRSPAQIIFASSDRLSELHCISLNLHLPAWF